MTSFILYPLAPLDQNCDNGQEEEKQMNDNYSFSISMNNAEKLLTTFEKCNTES